MMKFIVLNLVLDALDRNLVLIGVYYILSMVYVGPLGYGLKNFVIIY